MSKYHLNLFLPAEMTAATAGGSEHLQNVHIYPLEMWKDYSVEVCEAGASVNLVGLPTNGKVVLVSKKILRFFLKLEEAAEAEAIYFALWPKHPEYDVSVHVQPFLHQTFLPGLTTYNCVAVGDGYEIEAVVAPDVTEAEILSEIHSKLSAAGLPPAELCLQNILQDAWRSELDDTVLDALVQTSLELNDRGPDFEWYPVLNQLREMGTTLPNVFAFGTGAFPETMCVSWEANQNKNTTLCLDESFWSFVRKFGQLLK